MTSPMLTHVDNKSAIEQTQGEDSAEKEKTSCTSQIHLGLPKQKDDKGGVLRVAIHAS